MYFVKFRLIELFGVIFFFSGLGGLVLFLSSGGFVVLGGLRLFGVLELFYSSKMWYFC